VTDGLSETNVRMLMESIRTNGFWPSSPVVVDDEGTVVDGRHRTEACRRLGVTPVVVEREPDGFRAACRTMWREGIRC
jgi:ParB-like chromosome segregation protein Spo0J